MNPGCRVQDQLNTSEVTAPYIIGPALNLRKLSGRQWETNPQPSEQLRPMTIKTSAFSETATTVLTGVGMSRSVTLEKQVKVTEYQWRFNVFKFGGHRMVEVYVRWGFCGRHQKVPIVGHMKPGFCWYHPGNILQNVSAIFRILAKYTGSKVRQKNYVFWC